MPKKHTALLLKILSAVSFALMIAVNILADALPLNGATTGEVADSYPNLFSPAGLTFMIWGLIYLLLTGYTLYQLGLFKGNTNGSDPDLIRKINLLFSASSLCNTGWIFSWHYRHIGLSTVFMAGLLLCLIGISSVLSRQRLSKREKLLVRLPFSIYFGWITIATIANLTTFLVSIGWNGFGLSDTTWTIIMLAVGAAIGTAALWTKCDAAYGAAMLWGYIGVMIKHTSAAGFSWSYPTVVLASAGCIAILAMAILFICFKEQTPKKAKG